MRNLDTRLKRLEEKTPGDLERIVIRLGWGEGEWWEPPLIYLRSQDGKILKRVDSDGEPIHLDWGDNDNNRTGES